MNDRDNHDNFNALYDLTNEECRETGEWLNRRIKCKLCQAREATEGVSAITHEPQFCEQCYKSTAHKF